ncbi:MAG: RNA polymerase sigma factor [Actinomycetia bacterium]|nr:RNA polymerase sigma factor [Actinomycetes bacterium]
MGDARSDAELLRRLRADPELIAVLYQRHAQALFRYLSRRVGPDAGEDLLSEVFAAALSARGRVVPHHSGSALPWLYGIAANVSRAHMRQRQRCDLAASDELGGERGIPEDTLDWDAVDTRIVARARRDQLRAALGGLTGPERELLLLVAWEGLTPAEAAAALGISQLAARSRLHRARRRAARALDGLSPPVARPALRSASPLTNAVTSKESST